MVRLIIPASLQSKGAQSEGSWGLVKESRGFTAPIPPGLIELKVYKEETTREFCFRCFVFRDTLYFQFMCIHLKEGCLFSIENILFVSTTTKNDTKNMTCFIQGTDSLDTPPSLLSPVVTIDRHTQSSL